MEISELTSIVKSNKLYPVIFEKVYMSLEDGMSNDLNNLILGIAHSVLGSGPVQKFNLNHANFESYRQKIKERTNTDDANFDRYRLELKNHYYLYDLLFFYNPKRLEISKNEDGKLIPTTLASNYLANFYAKLFNTSRGKSNKVIIDSNEITCDIARSTSFLPRYETRTYQEVIREIGNQFEQYEEYRGANKIAELFIQSIQQALGQLEQSIVKGGERVFENKIKGLLDNGVRQIILTGAPGTGKTVAAEKIATEYGMRLKTVQFHPSYDYTDFVEGLRPVEIEGQMTFKKVDGIFKKFCRDVERSNDSEEQSETLHFFIIDEINRGDLSKVLGELMFCLEKDKRGKAIQTQYQNLRTFDLNTKKEMSEDEDIFTNGFFIPKNVVIIGTMNDIDRSVESFDFALRRRFTWIEAKANELLEEGLHRIFESDRPGIDLFEIRDRVLRLNETITSTGKKYSLNDSYHISHGYFANLPNELDSTEEVIEHVWEYRLHSLLTEYVRGEYDVEIFVRKCEQAFMGTDEWKV